MKSDKNPARAFLFDAYGTLFEVRSVIAAINQKFPGMGPPLSSQWRLQAIRIHLAAIFDGQI